MPLRIIKKGGDNSEDRQNRRVEHMIGKSRSSKREKGIEKRKMLTGGQAKIAAKAPPTNKIDAKDFAVLRAEKAKDRGMGLQDEKVKPGKVIKARKGMSFSEKMKMVEEGKINKKTGKFTSMDAMREAKGFKPGESAKDFNKRKAAEVFAKKAAKATGARGKLALGIAAAGVGAVQYLKSKMKKKKEESNKKMGGGMMKKYSTGGPTERAMGRAKELTASDMRDAKLKEKKYDKFLAGQESEFSQNVRAAKKLEKQIQKASPMAQSRLRERGQKKLFGAQASQDRLKASFRDTAKTLMGGGMMNKPMGYKSGKSIKVKCKLGRNKPTKMY